MICLNITEPDLLNLDLNLDFKCTELNSNMRLKLVPEPKLDQNWINFYIIYLYMIYIHIYTYFKLIYNNILNIRQNI